MNKKAAQVTRREFLKSAAGVAAFTLIPRQVLGGPGRQAPSDKLRVACIGVGGRGAASVHGVKGETLVALCDVDERRARGVFNEFPDVARYTDFRKMFDKIGKDIDAVTIGTPDHTHSIPAMQAIRMGKHLYCEKPMAPSLYEVRQLTEAARQHNVVTQLGNQGHSFDHIRLFCEWIWDGAIGDVREVHCMCDSNYTEMNNLGRLKETHPVPDGLDWNLWQGPVPERSYNPVYLPGRWRHWSAYGTGVIGDWVCHIVDPVFWALDLGAPTTIQAKVFDYHPVKHAETFPARTVVRYEFPARGDKPPVTLWWYDGAAAPERPADLESGRKVPEKGAIVVGDKGKMMYGSHGASGVRIFPEEKMQAYQRPEQTLPRVRGGHHDDWLRAIKEGKKAGSDFSYGGPLTEIALLGIAAIRLPGEKLQWDSKAFRFTNSDKANEMIRHPFRDGWTL